MTSYNNDQGHKYISKTSQHSTPEHISNNYAK